MKSFMPKTTSAIPVIIKKPSEVIYGSQVLQITYGNNWGYNDRYICTDSTTRCSGLYCGVSVVANQDWNGKISGSSPAFQFYAMNSFTTPNNNPTSKQSYAGWYKYDGLNSPTEISKGIKLLAYNISKTECESGIYDYGQVGDSDYFKAQHFAIGTGTNQCPSSYCNEAGKGACLMHPDKYVPKCNFIVKGDVPWVSRLKSSPYSFKEYQSSLSNYLNYYSLSSKNAPFGAINSPTIPGYDVYVNQINTNPQSPYYYHGLPLSCTGTGTVYMNGSWRNPCEALRYDSDGKIKLTLNTSDSNRFSSSANLNIARDSLKYVFAKISSNSGFNYDHTLKGSTPASVCNTAGCPPRESDINICSVYPQIENVKMSGPSGQINQMVREDGIPSNIYNIVSGGFYTLSFNTFVDSEQAPIKKLFIKIKRVDDSWEQVPNIVLSNIDHRPDSLNPHCLVKFLSPGQYIVLIKVIDNWDFFKCYGMGAFANTNGNCYKYCCGALIDGDSAYLENPFSYACAEPNRCTENSIRGALPVCN